MLSVLCVEGASALVNMSGHVGSAELDLYAPADTMRTCLMQCREALDMLELTRYCCRRMLLTHGETSCKTASTVCILAAFPVVVHTACAFFMTASHGY